MSEPNFDFVLIEVDEKGLDTLLARLSTLVRIKGKELAVKIGSKHRTVGARRN